MAGPLKARLAGIELYFENLDEARRFYSETLGLDVLDEEPGRYARLNTGPAFVCLERKGSEPYPSRDKAVIFLEVPNLQRAVNHIGRDKIVEMKAAGEGLQPPWAVLHDPEGHNIVIVEARAASSR
jgi:catechol 2,3-dioxygenase-like lactoylglutathione lyase family enzyme